MGFVGELLDALLKPGVNRSLVLLLHISFAGVFCTSLFLAFATDFFVPYILLFVLSVVSYSGIIW